MVTPLVGRHHSSAEDAFYTRVGERIRLARKERGLTQDALADIVHLTRSSITNIERGRQKLRLHTFAALAQALEQNPSLLLPAIDDVRNAGSAWPRGIAT